MKEKVYEIKHLQRSGGHAIIIWLRNHFSNFRFFNNVDRRGSTKGYEARPTDLKKQGTAIIFSYENYRVHEKIAYPMD